MELIPKPQPEFDEIITEVRDKPSFVGVLLQLDICIRVLYLLLRAYKKS